jgi:hypothetical protein
MVSAQLMLKLVCRITQVKAVGVFILVQQVQNRMTLVQWLMSCNHPINLMSSNKSTTRNTLLLLTVYRPSTLPASQNTCGYKRFYFVSDMDMKPVMIMESEY